MSFGADRSARVRLLTLGDIVSELTGPGEADDLELGESGAATGGVRRRERLVSAGGDG
jgi:hypothetical protein